MNDKTPKAVLTCKAKILAQHPTLTEQEALAKAWAWYNKVNVKVSPNEYHIPKFLPTPGRDTVAWLKRENERLQSLVDHLERRLQEVTPSTGREWTPPTNLKRRTLLESFNDGSTE